MSINLLELPSEIRTQIWNIVFQSKFVVPTETQTTIRQGGCLACLKEDHFNRIPWSEAFRPLLTCRQVYDEAAHILYASVQVHLGENIFHLNSLRPPFPSITSKVPSAVVWVHTSEENRVHWIEGLKSVGDAFPNLQHLTINAHMRPPDSYEKLIDAISLAIPIVKYSRDKRDMEVKLQFDYTYEDIMFDSPYLGEIRTTDALEEHELVLRDLIEDDAFIEAVLGDDEDEQAMVAALLRTARAHEQLWFEKLQRNRAARQRAQEQNQSVPKSRSSSTGATVDSAEDN